MFVKLLTGAGLYDHPRAIIAEKSLFMRASLEGVQRKHMQAAA